MAASNNNNNPDNVSHGKQTKKMTKTVSNGARDPRAHRLPSPNTTFKDETRKVKKILACCLTREDHQKTDRRTQNRSNKQQTDTKLTTAYVTQPQPSHHISNSSKA